MGCCDAGHSSAFWCSQRASTVLSTARENLIDFEVNFLSYLDYPAWCMNLKRDGSTLVSGAMLEPGCDVIQGYRTGIGQLVFVGKRPTLDNLGTDNSLVWIAPVVEA